jgi:hypothetical protein
MNYSLLSVFTSVLAVFVVVLVHAGSLSLR